MNDSLPEWFQIALALALTLPLPIAIWLLQRRTDGKPEQYLRGVWVSLASFCIFGGGSMAFAAICGLGGLLEAADPSWALATVGLFFFSGTPLLLWAGSMLYWASRRRRLIQRGVLVQGDVFAVQRHPFIPNVVRVRYEYLGPGNRVFTGRSPYLNWTHALVVDKIAGQQRVWVVYDAAHPDISAADVFEVRLAEARRQPGTLAATP